MKISLKAMRVNSDLTQAEAAKAAGVNRATIASWESYETFPTAQQLMTLCRIYKCDMSDIFIPTTLAKS